MNCLGSYTNARHFAIHCHESAKTIMAVVPWHDGSYRVMTPADAWEYDDAGLAVEYF